MQVPGVQPSTGLHEALLTYSKYLKAKLAGLMNDQKMLKELPGVRDEANASHHQLAGLNVQAAEAADCKTHWRTRQGHGGHDQPG